MVVDVDLVPDHGLHDRLWSLVRDPKTAMGDNDPLIALIVPVFELGENIEAPKWKDELDNLLATGMAKPILTPGKPGEVEAGNPKTHYKIVDYARWQKAQEGEDYGTQYNWWAEPYVAVNISHPCYPGFDSSFVYYGYDKQEHIHHLAVLGYHFIVVTSHFMSHVWHPSAKWSGGERKRTFREVTRLMTCQRVQREWVQLLSL
jgi:hypothetical protein